MPQLELNIGGLRATHKRVISGIKPSMFGLT